MEGMNEILIEKVESVDTEDCDIENLKETVSKFFLNFRFPKNLYNVQSPKFNFSQSDSSCTSEIVSIIPCWKKSTDGYWETWVWN